MKILIREVSLNRFDVYEYASKIEDTLAEEDDIDFDNMHIKGNNFIQFIVNKHSARVALKDFLIAKFDFILVVEFEGQRFFGKIVNEHEKTRYENANPEVNVL